MPFKSNTRFGRWRENISTDVCKWSRRYSIGVWAAFFDGRLRRFREMVGSELRNVPFSWTYWSERRDAWEDRSDNSQSNWEDVDRQFYLRIWFLWCVQWQISLREPRRSSETFHLKIFHQSTYFFVALLILNLVHLTLVQFHGTSDLFHFLFLRLKEKTNGRVDD